MSFVNRGRSVWKLKSRSLELGARTLVMGVLNVTPDSFSDGGLFVERSEAVEHALAMMEAGADILDVGGESTRPGKYEAVMAQAEMARVVPVIEDVLRHKPGTVISIDTYKAQTAVAAVAAGAEIVNDVSGFLWDERMAATCAELRCGVVLMHTRGRPEEWKHLPRMKTEEVLPLVKRELDERLAAALAAGCERESIVLDPGFGFGKAFENNYALLLRMHELRELGQPLLAGVSRKSFLSKTLAAVYRDHQWLSESPPGLHPGHPPSLPPDPLPEALETASLAAMVASILNGADIVRVHRVGPAVEAAGVVDAILAAQLPAAE